MLMHFLLVFNLTQFCLDDQPGNEYFLIPLVFWHPWHPWVSVYSDLKEIWAIPPTVAWILTKNYNTSNLLFISQIIWFLTYAWFLFQACDVRGSANTTTTVDSNSGSLKNETCKCKNFVKGEFCNECKEGYWNLTQINPDGCQSK